MGKIPVSGYLGIWGFGDLVIWLFGDLFIWGFVYLVICLGQAWYSILQENTNTRLLSRPKTSLQNVRR